MGQTHTIQYVQAQGPPPHTPCWLSASAGALRRCRSATPPPTGAFEEEKQKGMTSQAHVHKATPKARRKLTSQVGDFTFVLKA